MSIAEAFPRAEITRGDSVPVPVYVIIDGCAATPDNVSGVKITIGQFSAFWPNGTLECRDGVWLFPLTEEKSRRLRPGPNPVRAVVRAGDYQVCAADASVYVN